MEATNKGRALRIEGNGLCLEAARKPKFWSEYLGNNLNAWPSTVNVIEAVRLCAFAPPSSPLV